MTRVLVAIPWRFQHHRVPAYNLTVARYRELLPNTVITCVDTVHEPFCLAACRNEGVRLAEQGGYDIAVLGDADTLPERDPLLEAIEQARHSRFVHLPYTEYRSLRRDGTKQYRAGTPLEECNHLTVPAACSGVFVTTPAAWWSVGGQDERFRGWGPEDMAFLIAHRALLGAEPARHEGCVYSLHHDSPVKTGLQCEANVVLYQRYLAAAETNPDAVRAIIAESRGVTTGVD